jgi:putative DNA primase/helicase
MAAPDFRGVAASALARSEDLVPRWLPDGRKEGPRWVAVNPRRPGSDGSGGFSVNMHTGEWGDWVTQTKGGDLVSLYAYLNGVDQWPACQAVAKELGIDPGGSGGGGQRAVDDGRAARAQRDGEVVVPVPAGAPSFESLLDHYKLGRAVAHWPYRDARGALLMVVMRWNAPTEKDPGKKEIMPHTLRRLPSGVLVWKRLGLPKPWPLYRLDELARRPAATVLVCEGEKAADAAQLLLPEYVATTSPSGGGNARFADWSPLAARRVLIWPDHDAAGIGYVDTVRARLADEGAASVQVLAFSWVAKALAAAQRGAAA